MDTETVWPEGEDDLRAALRGAEGACLQHLRSGLGAEARPHGALQADEDLAAKTGR